MPQPPTPVPRARLLVQVTESGRPRSFDWSLPTTPGAELTVGRSRSADLTLRDEHVSGRHLRITVTPGNGQTPPGHALIDLETTNGTTLNGQAFASHTPQPLSPGDRILLGGSAEMVYQIDPSTAPPSTGTSASASGAGSSPQDVTLEPPPGESVPPVVGTAMDQHSVTLTGEEIPFDDPSPPATPWGTVVITVAVGLAILGVLGYFAWVLLGPAAG